MKVEIERIDSEPLTLQEDIPVTGWDLDSFDVKFVDAIHLVCSFARFDKEIIVEAVVTVHRNICCSRCLEEKRQTTTQEFTLNYNVHHLGKYLEIDKDIREEILLNFPMKVLCSTECKGLCPGCKVNLNFEQCRCSA
ncbi:MAG: DUF177 domain-containing protein [Candidatus Omnitrophota bacterium]